MNKKGATYLEGSASLGRAKRGLLKGGVSLVASLILLFLALSSFLPAQAATAPPVNHPQVAEAGFLGALCGNENELGLGMDTAPWRFILGSYPQPDASGRHWTGLEAFGNNIMWPHYWGEGGAEQTLVIDVGTERGAGIGNFSEKLQRLEEARTWYKCSVDTALTGVGSGFLILASAVTHVVQLAATSAFDSNIVCKDPVNPQGVCFNLLKIIGGTGGSNEGIIGALTSSVYLPLMGMMAAIIGIWVTYKGIVQRKLREAAGGLLWMFFTFLLSVIFLMNPLLLSRAPMAVSNVVTTCVVGAFNGQNCMSGSVSPPSSTVNTTDQICASTASGLNLDQQMSMTVNSLSCSIWKAFVLQAYAQGSFGQSLEALDTSKPATAAAISAAGISPNTFCVNMASTASVNGTGQMLNLDSGAKRVCNLAVYQLYLQTDARSAGDTVPTSGLDKRWYNIIMVVANNDYMWSHWSGGMTGGLNKALMGGTSLVAAVAGGLVVLVIAAFALIYYLTSIIMIAFAPVFLLLGVHPGRGKKIMLGWAEHLISNVLKYLISAVFLIVTLAFYGAVIGASDNMALTLLFIVLLSLALLLYRKELVEMVGKVNMGGQQLSNKFSQTASKYTTAAAGGALGGVLATGANPFTPGGLKQVATGAVGGMSDGVGRELKRTTGVVGYTAREVSRAKLQNKREVAQIAGSEATKSAELKRALVEDERNARAEESSLDQREAEIAARTSQAATARNREELAREAESSVLAGMSDKNPLFAQAQALVNQIRDLKFQREVAVARGDSETSARLDEEIALKEATYTDIASDPQLTKNWTSLRRDYLSRTQRAMRVRGVEDLMNETTRTEGKAELLELDGIINDYNRTVDNFNTLAVHRNGVAQEQIHAEVKARILREVYDKLPQAQGLTDAELEKLNERARREADLEIAKLEGMETKTRLEAVYPSFKTSYDELAAGSRLPKPTPEEAGDAPPSSKRLYPVGKGGWVPLEEAPDWTKRAVVGDDSENEEHGLPVVSVSARDLGRDIPSGLRQESGGISRNYGASDNEGIVHRIDEETPGARYDKTEGKWFIPLEANESLAFENGKFAVQRAGEERQARQTMSLEGMSPEEQAEYRNHLRQQQGDGNSRYYGVMDKDSQVVSRVTSHTPNARVDERGRWYVEISGEERLHYSPGAGWSIEGDQGGEWRSKPMDTRPTPPSQEDVRQAVDAALAHARRDHENKTTTSPKEASGEVLWQQGSQGSPSLFTRDEVNESKQRQEAQAAARREAEAEAARRRESEAREQNESKPAFTWDTRSESERQRDFSRPRPAGGNEASSLAEMAAQARREEEARDRKAKRDATAHLSPQEKREERKQKKAMNDLGEDVIAPIVTSAMGVPSVDMPSGEMGKKNPHGKPNPPAGGGKGGLPKQANDSNRDMKDLF